MQPMDPHMANLPKEVVGSNLYRFKNTGIEYFDPFEVTVFRRLVKNSSLSNKCLATDAFHLQLVG